MADSSESGDNLTGRMLADFMKPTYEELSRRREVQSKNAFDENQEKNISFPRAEAEKGVKPLPFDIPDQRFVVYGLSHQGIPPISTEPGVRFCGVFADNAEAVHHAERISSADPDCSMLISTTKEWVTMASSFDLLSDQKSYQDHIEQILAAYRREVKRNEHEFKDRLRPQEDVENDDEKDVENDGEKDVEKDATETSSPDGGCNHSHRSCYCDYPRDLEVRNQRVAVVSFLQDLIATDSEPKQPLFILWAVFDSTDEADAWIRNHAGDRIHDVDLDTVDMYEWLFPNSATDDKMSKVIYRNEEKQKIMDFVHGQASTVDSFKEFCKANSQAAPVIEI
jgi:hypothetical protein